MNKRKRGFALLLDWAGKDKWYLYLSMLLAFLSSLSAIVPYFVFYRLITAVVSGDLSAGKALQLTVILVTAAAIRSLCGYTSSVLSHRGAYNTLYRVRCMVTEHMAKMPLGALSERSTGEIKFVMNESIEKLELFLAHNLPELVLYLSGPVVMFVFLLSINLTLALVSIVPLFLAGFVIVLMFKRFSRFMTNVNQSGGSLSTAIHEYVGGMRLIKAYQMSAASFRTYASAVADQHRVWGEISRAVAPLYAAYIVLLECGILMLVPLGGYLYVRGSIGAGVLLLFAFVGTQYLSDIRPLQELGSGLSYAMNAVNQVEEILNSPIFGNGKPFPNTHDISVEDVSFTYQKSGEMENSSAAESLEKEKTSAAGSIPPEAAGRKDGIGAQSEPETTDVLKNCSLHIGHGERVAFVGRSGAGKTTLVQLISRFYDVSNGCIRIGGVDIRELDYEELLRNISVVFQQSFLTKGSVFENIAMGSENATLKEVREAAKKAQIDDFIMSLPDAYDTLVGGYGTRFSGGEKQRICIARAIFKNAPILILDEATSAADPENQVEIDRAIEQLCIGKTVIIVAHRLGITRSCDKVVVLEDGRITGVGSFEEMRTQNTYFSRAWADYTEARTIRYSREEKARSKAMREDGTVQDSAVQEEIFQESVLKKDTCKEDLRNERTNNKNLQKGGDQV